MLLRHIERSRKNRMTICITKSVNFGIYFNGLLVWIHMYLPNTYYMNYHKLILVISLHFPPLVNNGVHKYSLVLIFALLSNIIGDSEYVY